MRRFFIIFVLLVSSCASENAISNLDLVESNIFSCSNFYDMILKSPQWAEMHTFDEKIEACQLPIENVDKMSTGELVYACITHPLAQLYMANPKEFEVFEKVLGKTLVFNALSLREDAAQNLVSYYGKATIQTDLQQYRLHHSSTELTISQMHVLELIIASGFFPAVFDEPLASDLKLVTSNHLALRRLSPELFSTHSKKVAALILRELEADAPFTLEKANQVLDEMMARESTSIRTKAAGDILGTTYYKTPKGSSIYALICEDYSASEKATVDNAYCLDHPNATLIESSSYCYNHHYYAWCAPFGGPDLWINLPSAFITDGTYVTSTFSSADVVYSSSDDFSAIPTATQGIVISKWGYGPVMQHAINDSPKGVISSVNYYQINSGSFNVGSIDGDEFAPVGTECTYSYTPFSGYPSNASFEWGIQNSHMNPSEYSYSTNGNQLFITFNVPGEFYIDAYYHVNGYYFAHDEILVQASYEFNNISEPDSTASIPPIQEEE